MTEYEAGTAADKAIGESAPAGRSRGWVIALLIVLAVILVCCLCLFAAIAGYAVLSPVTTREFRTIIETIEVATPLP